MHTGRPEVMSASDLHDLAVQTAHGTEKALPSAISRHLGKWVISAPGYGRSAHRSRRSHAAQLPCWRKPQPDEPCKSGRL